MRYSKESSKFDIMVIITYLIIGYIISILILYLVYGIPHIENLYPPLITWITFSFSVISTISLIIIAYALIRIGNILSQPKGIPQPQPRDISQLKDIPQPQTRDPTPSSQTEKSLKGKKS